ERTAHGDADAIAVLVFARGMPERLGVLGRRPVGAPHPVAGRKLHDAGKIARGHGQKTCTALALNANVTGTPGASPSSRAASAVTVATSSTPKSAVTCTVPGRWRATRVTSPENTLRADEASGARLTKMSVGGTARMAGPARSAITAMATGPTGTCVTPSAPAAGTSTRNRFSG